MDHSSKNTLTRRQFLKTAAAAATIPLLPNVLLPSGPPAYAAGPADLVIAKNGNPAQLLQAAMAPLGGMSRFVKKGPVPTTRPSSRP
jgi:hypothetical protein